MSFRMLGKLTASASESAGASVVALLRALIARWTVSSANATANVDIADVIGNKTDTAAETADVVSIVRLLRALIARWAVSTADVADNADIADVIGNKSDTTAGTSIVSLIRKVIRGTGAIKALPNLAAGVTVTGPAGAWGG